MPHERTPLLRIALIVWAVVISATCVRSMFAPRSHSVYAIFAEAGRAWLRGGELYTAPAGDTFRYGPVVAATFAPLGLLPDAVGGLLWRVSNAAALLVGLGAWCRLAHPGDVRRSAWFLLLMAPLAVGNLNNGQSNPLLLGALLLAVYAAARGGWNGATLAVVVPALFKIYPLCVGLLLAALAPRQLAPRLLAALAAGLAVPFLLQSPDYVAMQYAHWWHYLGADDRQVYDLSLWYRDLRLLAAHAGWHLSGSVYLALQLAAAMAICLACVVVRRGVLLFGLAACWMTLLGPAAESATYLVLAPTAVSALLDAWLEPRVAWRRVVASTAFGLLLVAQIAVWFPFGRAVQTLGPQPLAALLLAALLVAEVRACTTARSPEEVPSCTGWPSSSEHSWA